MTQEEAMNMSNEQAVQILIPMRNMMCDQSGCPISDAVFALDKAIESLSADVAPVVRCKDCTYYCPLDDSRPSNCLMSGFLCVRKDDFCSCGKERR